jgi:anti-sigma-K factor RskA
MLDGMTDDVPQHLPSRREARGLARPAKRWGRMRIVLVSAAAVVAVVAGGIAVAHFTNPMTVLVSAQDVRQVTEPVQGGGTATVTWSDSLGRSAVTVHGLGRLPEHFVYQLWYIGDEIRAAGTFTGDTSVVLPGDLRPGDQVAISIEPAGGSAQPTSDPILAVQT